MSLIQRREGVRVKMSEEFGLSMFLIIGGLYLIVVPVFINPSITIGLLSQSVGFVIILIMLLIQLGGSKS